METWKMKRGNHVILKRMSCPDSCNNFWLVGEREFCACWTQVHIFGNSFRTKYFPLGVLETLGDMVIKSKPRG